MTEPLKNTGKCISKIKKYKTHITLFINKERINISDEVYSSFYLYEGKQLSSKEYKELISKIEIEKYLNYGMKVASNKLLSEWKMREKLYQKEASKSQVDLVITTLKKQGLIDDQLFIEEYVEYANNHLLGKNKIKTNLLNKGIFEEDISKIKFPESVEIKKAYKLLPKLIKRYDRYNAAKQKEHIIQALIREGYDLSVALEVIKDIKLSNPKKEINLLKKDYELIRKKYARNYEGRELKEKIITSLLRKGYKRKDIFKMMDEEYEIY